MLTIVTIIVTIIVAIVLGSLIRRMRKLESHLQAMGELVIREQTANKILREDLDELIADKEYAEYVERNQEADECTCSECERARRINDLEWAKQ